MSEHQDVEQVSAALAYQLNQAAAAQLNDEGRELVFGTAEAPKSYGSLPDFIAAVSEAKVEQALASATDIEREAARRRLAARRSGESTKVRRDDSGMPLNKNGQIDTALALDEILRGNK